MTTKTVDWSPDGRGESLETRDWLESLRDVLALRGPERLRRLLEELQIHAQRAGVTLPVTSQTPYVNTLPAEQDPPFPGSLPIERRIKSLARWNAMAMVIRANRESSGIGGHISTFASAATLYEVGFNHFFRGRDHECGGDLVYFQGHAAPGIYARAFLEGRLTEKQIENFRRELQPEGGISSYPHPWLMPEFWQFPTVSMGLGPIQAIYQARFLRYLHHRGLSEDRGARVWAFVGDGECDEPETLGAITLASREKLDNLIFVINCNLQRLDGPVRGNGKIVQELEAIFRGSGWNVIKLLWGRDWDRLLARDHEGLLVRRLGEVVDGEYQKYRVEGGAYIRKHLFGADPRLEAMVRDLSDQELWKMTLGGHDPVKVYAAYRAAVTHQGAPTVILAQTIKGYGLGEAGEGMNITHQQKKLNEDELLSFRNRFDIPISEEEVGRAPFYRPPDDSAEILYLQERRRALGGYLPERRTVSCSIHVPGDDFFKEFHQGTGERAASTTGAFVRMLAKLMREKEIGRRIVPIIPDESRTFGADVLFRQYGIYSSVGQLYEPVDASSLLYYKEARDGQLLEEGLTEAGSMCSFIAAGTAHATRGLCMVPLFLFYSMFGFQRIGDLIWAAADSRARGFMVGGIAGRTTINGEGLQHQDGHSLLHAATVPNVLSYDPAYAYEIAVIVQEGLRRMYQEDEDVFYYFMMGNESYPQLPMPEGAREGILRGAYCLRNAETPRRRNRIRVRLLGSGSILNEVLKAQQILAERYEIAADVWSVTSYTELRRDALDADRWNLLHPGEKPQVPYVTQCFDDGPNVFVAASDYMKALPDGIARWLPGPLLTLGTDGFGRSDSREVLRDFFEVDARHVVLGALSALLRAGKLEADVVKQAVADLEINPEKPNPMRS